MSPRLGIPIVPSQTLPWLSREKQFKEDCINGETYDPSEPISIFNHPPILSMSLREVNEWERSWL